MHGRLRFAQNKLIHVDRVDSQSRLQVLLRIGHVDDRQKQHYQITDQYLIQKITNLYRDKRGNLHIEGVIEQQLINEFLEISAEFDNVEPTTQILRQHTIPAYYEDMEEVEARIQAWMQRSENK